MTWLKRLIAPREMAELERWRGGCVLAQRWLAEFPEVWAALAHLERVALGFESPELIDRLIGYMRSARAADVVAKAAELARAK